LRLPQTTFRDERLHGGGIDGPGRRRATRKGEGHAKVPVPRVYRLGSASIV